VSAVLGGALYLCQLNRDAVVALLGNKEIAVATMILGGGTAYFIVLFLVGAVSFAEVRAAFRRERGPAGGGGGLPPGFDG
jgi:hypothetical protein